MPKGCRSCLQVRRASHRALIPDTTSQLCGRTPASEGPQGPSTVRRARKKKESKHVQRVSVHARVSVVIKSKLRSLICTSGVPQKVVVVPLASRPSLQRPKSVRTICPCESNRIFSGFRSLKRGHGKASQLHLLPLFRCAHVMLKEINKGALQDRGSPVDNVQGVEVAQGTCNFSSIEPGSGLQEDPFSLKMVEQLEAGRDLSASP